MTEQISEQADQGFADDGGARLVPVAESIKYRRRAQQAEARVNEFEQQLKELHTQLDGRNDELATAEAQRDETNMRLAEVENSRNVDRMLAEAGAVDLEAASLLLARRVDLTKDLADDQLRGVVEQLLQSKPFLRAGDAVIPGRAMPSVTSSARGPQLSEATQIAAVAQRATASGNRKDMAEYLRLRRQASNMTP